jgi:hypothetical protein
MGGPPSRPLVLAAAAALAGALAGCMLVPPKQPAVPTAPAVEVVAPEPPPPPPPPPPRVSDSERLLYYYEYVLALTPEQVARESERTQRFFGQHRSEFALLQLVLLKCLPAAPPKDRAQALETLALYLKETRDRPSELRPFALMLNNLLLEQQRQDAELQTQAQKLKEEARRNDELKQKLDALVETERKMLERNQETRNQ